MTVGIFWKGTSEASENGLEKEAQTLGGQFLLCPQFPLTPEEGGLRARATLARGKEVFC